MKTNKPQPAKVHKSKVLDTLLGGIMPPEQERTEKRMLLAARIDEGRKAKGWNQNQFAEAMGKQPSEISKWLSGTHNFTAETLWDIEEKLDIELISLKEPPVETVKVMEFRIEISRPVISKDADYSLKGLTKKRHIDPESICYG